MWESHPEIGYSELYLENELLRRITIHRLTSSFCVRVYLYDNKKLPEYLAIKEYIQADTDEEAQQKALMIAKEYANKHEHYWNRISWLAERYMKG